MICQENEIYVDVCALDDLTPLDGICALVDNKQVAIFRVDNSEQVYALDNYDPIGKANILSRGIIGDVQGDLVVASPMYKQHFSLYTGHCLEKQEIRVATYHVRIQNGRVQIGSRKEG